MLGRPVAHSLRRADGAIGIAAMDVNAKAEHVPRSRRRLFRAGSSSHHRAAYALLFGLTLAGFASPALALNKTIATEETRIHVETFAAGLVHPWGMAFLPEGGMLVTERPGRLRYVAPDGKVSAPLSGMPTDIASGGQCGLLGIALDPDFVQNRLVYLAYCQADLVDPGKNNIAVVRGRVSEEHKRFTHPQYIFTAQPKVRSVTDNGGFLRFDDSGHLYITVGDKFERTLRMQAQNLDSDIGKIIRINPNGTVPPDNPFYARSDALGEVWAYGSRNAEGLAFDPHTHRLWEVEDGPKGGDELNIIEPGENYGWPIISDGVNDNGTPIGTGKTHEPGMRGPVYHWTPSIKPSGIAFYTANAFPAWTGDLFIGARSGHMLVRLALDGKKVTHQEDLLKGLGLPIRSVSVGPGGSLYLLTDQEDGEILRVSPAAPPGAEEASIGSVR
jgi:glucose/arabinose dehydrogenase